MQQMLREGVGVDFLVISLLLMSSLSRLFTAKGCSTGSSRKVAYS